MTTSETVHLTAQSYATRITDLVAADAVRLPTLPEVAIKAREILQSERANARDLATLLSQDGAMVAALMRLANSATFGGLGRVETLGAAIQRIGQRQVGAIVLGLGLKEHFRHDDPVKAALLDTLWTHSVTAAFAAKAIGSKVGLDPERAFLAGILHDIGKVVVLSALDELEDGGAAPETSEATMRELMRTLHGSLGHRVLSTWNLPPDLAEVARTHHESAWAGQDLVLSVQAANLITRRLGFHLDPDPSVSVLGDPVAAELGLTDLEVATLMVDMEEHLDEMRRLF